MKLYLKIIIGCAVLFPIGYFLYFLVAMMVFADSIPSPDDVPLNKKEATALKDDFSNYGKIIEMDDATRCYKSINHKPVAISEFDTEDSSTSSHCNESKPNLYEVLKELDIEKSKYLEFRERLEYSKLRSYCYDDDRHIFIVNGMFDSVWGYLYSESILTVNESQLYLCNGYSINIMKDLGDNWYKISGS